MDLCQNNSETAESIKEDKAIHACSIQEAKTLCSVVIREAEAWGVSQAGSFQQSHAKAIQHPEEEAIEEESKGQLNFPSTCQAALGASTPKLHGMLVASYKVLLGHALMSHPFSLSQGAFPSGQGSTPGFPSLLHLSVHLDPADVLQPSGTMSKATSEGLPSLR